MGVVVPLVDQGVWVVVAHPLATSVEAEGDACDRRPSSSGAVVVSEA